MSEKKCGSHEQMAEEITRQILAKRNKLLDDFFLAYASELSFLKEDFFISDICLVEQEPSYRDVSIQRKYWFEFKEKTQNE